MSDIDITQALSKLQAMAAAAHGQAPQPSAGGSADFGKLLQSAVDKVNEAQVEAGKMSDAFEKGETTDLTQVMIALQKARISFQAMVEVRNKLVGAYQDIMNMQI
jgi:flagellar hook-basal body complex protein FliE